MKRLALAITAASLLFGTAAMAAPYQAHRAPAEQKTVTRTVTHADYRGHDTRTVTRAVYRDHDFRAGQRLPARYVRGPAINWRAYRLRQPPRGYQWVRAHNNFVLVTRSNGLIIDLAFAR